MASCSPALSMTSPPLPYLTDVLRKLADFDGHENASSSFFPTAGNFRTGYPINNPLVTEVYCSVSTVGPRRRTAYLGHVRSAAHFEREQDHSVAGKTSRMATAPFERHRYEAVPCSRGLLIDPHKAAFVGKGRERYCPISLIRAA